MDSLTRPHVPARGQIVRRAGGWSWGPRSPASPALRRNGGGLGVGLSQGPGVGPGQLAMEPSHRNRHTQVTEAQFLLDMVSTHLPSPDTTGPVSAGPYHLSPDSRPPVPGLCLPGHLTAGLARAAQGPGPCTQGALQGSSL